MFVATYFRASTAEQDTSRARGVFNAFAVEQGLRIAARYLENENGAKGCILLFASRRKAAGLLRRPLVRLSS